MGSTAAQPGALLERMAAFADATRLRLLRLLEKSELGVADLMELLQLPQSTVSRHLKVLADQGLLTSRAVGATRLNRMPEIDDAAARRFWMTEPTKRQDEKCGRRQVSELNEAVAHRFGSRSRNIFSMRSVMRNPLTMLVIEANSAIAPRMRMVRG